MAPLSKLLFPRLFCHLTTTVKKSQFLRQENNWHISRRWFQRSSGERPKIGLEKKNLGLAPVKLISGDPAGFKILVKPFLFTIGFCGCSYLGACIWQYENVRRQAINQAKEQWHGMWKNKNSYKQGEVRRQLNIWWNSLTEGQRVAFGIVAANCLVFSLWRVPSLRPTMIRYFSSNPSSKSVCLPMFLSTFSHYTFFHLLANMYVLYGFSTTAVSMFGKEQFLGLYLSSGVVASFASYVYKVSTKRLNPSLGASGAIMSLIAAVCFQHPNAQLSILFMPFLSFSAGTAIKVVMGVDAAGLLMGWQFLDHAAHLGGALFGIGYLFFGMECSWYKREPILQWWHKFREGTKSGS